MLDPRDVTLEVGVYYLLVRPIGQAGVNSSNASVYITSIAAQCKYWDETETNWSDYGCRVRLTSRFFLNYKVDYKKRISIVEQFTYSLICLLRLDLVPRHYLLSACAPI